MWEAAKNEIRNRRRVVYIGFDPSGEYEDAMQLLLDILYEKDNVSFFYFLEITLGDFIRWDTGKTDLSKVFHCLVNLNIPKEQLQNLKTL